MEVQHDQTVCLKKTGREYIKILTPVKLAGVIEKGEVNILYYTSLHLPESLC
jgi:hypothetical protein